MTNEHEKLEACRIIYLAQDGRDHALLELKMRIIGYRFNRRVLYGRTIGETFRPGWPTLHGWKHELAECESPRVSEGDMSTHAEEFSRKAAKTQSGEGSIHRDKGDTRDAEDIHRRVAETLRMPNTDLRSPVSGLASPVFPHSGTPQHPDSALPTFADFQDWLRSTAPEMSWDRRHQLLIYRKLRSVTDGTCKRLMIFMPPRHGKSELVTIRYAAWRLWQDPKMRVVIGSYNQHLASRFSRSIRRVLSEEEDKHGGTSGDVFRRERGRPRLHERSENSRDDEASNGSREDVSRQDATTQGGGEDGDANVPVRRERMFPPSRSINTMAEWETAAGGGVKAVGVGAGITGFGADLVIIDDPVKSRAEAESKTYRDRVWDWFRDDISTRLEPNAPMVLIQTRWHEDDLAGRILNEMQNGGELWEVLSLPALAQAAFPGNAGALACMSGSENSFMDEQANEASRCESPRVSKADMSTPTEEISRKDAKTQSEAGSIHRDKGDKRDSEAIHRRDAETQRRAGANSTLRVSPLLTRGLSHSFSDTHNAVISPLLTRGLSHETVGLPHGTPEVSHSATHGSSLPSPVSRLLTPQLPNFLDLLGRRPGDALWPERFSREMLLSRKERIGSYSFASLYQQIPSPAEGGHFKRAWLRQIVEAAPAGLTWFRGYDLAVSKRTTADHTASFRVAMDDAGNFYIADGFRRRLEFPDQRRYIIERMLAEPDTIHGVEAALHGQGIVQDIRTERRLAHIPLMSVPVEADKVTRALAWAAHAEAGKLFLVRGGWISEFIEEAASFPNGRHDDQVDAVSLAFRLLAMPKAKPKVYVTGGA